MFPALLVSALLAFMGAPVSGPPGLVMSALVSAPPGLVMPAVAVASSSVPLGLVMAELVRHADPPPGATRFRWPSDAHRVTRRFDPPPKPWLAGHRGVDLASSPSAVVRTAGPGRVVFAGQVAGRGVVSVAHPGGLRTTYEPISPSVAVDDEVAAGGEIGRLVSGHPGCPEEACLHWGLRRGELYLDPLALLGLGRVRLLPMNGGPAS
jgi:murein DD-endopeptidase MepM/ murein hydrolase activator NlpD